MKIVGFTMVTNPDYRQDPWRASLLQALEIFDQVVVVYGRFEDGAQIEALRREEGIAPERLLQSFLDWPQPEWSYEELPRHLNHALDMVRGTGADWAVKFDIDCFFHEDDADAIRSALRTAKTRRKALAAFEKLQFFLVDRAYEKGKMPLALNMAFPVCYGLDKTRYTDLCQPIIPVSETAQFNPNGYPIPKGAPFTSAQIMTTSVHVWNYDYSFKTEDRARELLFHFDRSHARWWSAGYSGRRLDTITPESAIADYVMLVRGRIRKCVKKFSPADHPRHIQPLVAGIKLDQFGHSLWGKISLET